MSFDEQMGHGRALDENRRPVQRLPAPQIESFAEPIRAPLPHGGAGIGVPGQVDDHGRGVRAGYAARLRISRLVLLEPQPERVAPPDRAPHTLPEPPDIHPPRERLVHHHIELRSTGIPQFGRPDIPLITVE
nr:hypothetical protein [Nocardia terpenica]